jgi:hypothetical protein
MLVEYLRSQHRYCLFCGIRQLGCFLHFASFLLKKHFMRKVYQLPVPVCVWDDSLGLTYNPLTHLNFKFIPLKVSFLCLKSSVFPYKQKYFHFFCIPVLYGIPVPYCVPVPVHFRMF